MYICELSFDKPDPKNPYYSLDEVDYYAWVPALMGIDNHRLSLRKNLITGEFEVYRRFYQRRLVAPHPNIIGVVSHDTGLEEIAFRGTFEEALRFADKEYYKYHGEREPDKPCKHIYPEKSSLCGKDKG